MTKQRELILDIVNSSHIHPTAEQIYMFAKEKMPKIVMATVYNNINALTEMGMIRRVTVHGEPDRYDNARTQHEHLKCDRCGRLTDIYLGNTLAELENKTGIKLTSYELNMHYICGDCRGNNKN